MMTGTRLRELLAVLAELRLHLLSKRLSVDETALPNLGLPFDPVGTEWREGKDVA